MTLINLGGGIVKGAVEKIKGEVEKIKGEVEKIKEEVERGNITKISALNEKILYTPLRFKQGCNSFGGHICVMKQNCMKIFANRFA